MKIILDSSLKQIECNGNLDTFINYFIDNANDIILKLHDIEKQQKNQIFHNNFISYLSICYVNHMGIVISPDMICYVK